ncbi:Starch binding protein [Gracilaria domingensis]|nr:Starch binding protein [Gracilaria domingensis]KAI0557169.1 Starch binding protein [Gracilaria domingensis]
MRSLLWDGIVTFFGSVFDNETVEVSPQPCTTYAAPPQFVSLPSKDSAMASSSASDRVQSISTSQHSIENVDEESLYSTATSLESEPLASGSPHLNAMSVQSHNVSCESREEQERRLESVITVLFRRFCYGQAVVIGKLPPLLPRAAIYFISPDVDVSPYCWHVQCNVTAQEWPASLALMRFEATQSTVWLMRLQNASDGELAEHLEAAANMSAPCSVLILMSWSVQAMEIADEAGFSQDRALCYERPLHLLRRKERRARWYETDSPYTSASNSPPPEPAVDGRLVQFRVHLDGELKQRLRGRLAKVVGNCEALGGWEVGRGARMEAFEGWMFTEVFVLKREVEYKYVLVDEEGGVLWEGGENRRLFADAELTVRVDDRWRR